MSLARTGPFGSAVAGFLAVTGDTSLRNLPPPPSLTQINQGWRHYRSKQLDDAAYFRDHAERYRKLADTFRDHPISTRLAMLADEFDSKARNLPRKRACAVHCDRDFH